MQTFAGPYMITHPDPFTPAWRRLALEGYADPYSATIDGEHWWSDGVMFERISEPVPAEVQAIDQTAKIGEHIEKCRAFETIPLPSEATADLDGRCTFDLVDGRQVTIDAVYVNYLGTKRSSLHVKRDGSLDDPLVILDANGKFAGALMPMRPTGEPQA